MVRLYGARKGSRLKQWLWCNRKSHEMKTAPLGLEINYVEQGQSVFAFASQNECTVCGAADYWVTIGEPPVTHSLVVQL